MLAVPGRGLRHLNGTKRLLAVASTTSLTYEALLISIKVTPRNSGAPTQSSNAPATGPQFREVRGDLDPETPRIAGRDNSSLAAVQDQIDLRLRWLHSCRQLALRFAGRGLAQEVVGADLVSGRASFFR